MKTNKKELDLQEIKNKRDHFNQNQQREERMPLKKWLERFKKETKKHKSNSNNKNKSKSKTQMNTKLKLKRQDQPHILKVES